MANLLVSKEINEYTEQYTSAESPELAALNRETHLKIAVPEMLSGQVQGKLLEMLSYMLRPKNILEIGTYTGYSAICLAKGLQEGGKLHTIDIDEELEEIAFKYICREGLQDKIVQHIGDASGIISTLDETFDLVFIDADKPNYCLYYDLVFDKVAPGGFIMADNVLYNAEVVMPEEQQSKNARSVHAFNEMVKKDNRVEHVLVSVRDGIMIVRKK